MVDRLISAVLAVCLACLVWLYARGREQESLDNIPIAVQLALAAGQADQYDLEVTGPSQVVVSFTGPPSRIRELRGQLQRGEIHVEITLSVPEDRQKEARFLDTVRVEPADVAAPPGVTPVVVEGRNRIPVTLHRLVERRLPVRFDPTSEEGVGKVSIEPATVLVRGPQDILERTRAISTQPWSLPLDPSSIQEQDMGFMRRVQLVQEIEGRPVRPTPADVAVRFTIRARQKVYELKDVPVRFLCPANYPLRPRFSDENAGKITIRVLGPASEIPPAVLAVIDLTGGKFEPGLYTDEPVKLQLPKDFQLAQEAPRSAAFQLTPTETPAKGQDHLVQKP